ncbi:unnamed protein product, partial [Hapterophycus canaliculatus]
EGYCPRLTRSSRTRVVSSPLHGVVAGSGQLKGGWVIVWSTFVAQPPRRRCWFDLDRPSLESFQKSPAFTPSQLLLLQAFGRPRKSKTEFVCRTPGIKKGNRTRETFKSTP